MKLSDSENRFFLEWKEREENNPEPEFSAVGYTLKNIRCVYLERRNLEMWAIKSKDRKYTELSIYTADYLMSLKRLLRKKVITKHVFDSLEYLAFSNSSRHLFHSLIREPLLIQAMKQLPQHENT